MFLFPWNCISLSLEMDGEKKVYRDLLFDGRQMVLSVCPVRGHCTHCVLCYFMLQDRLWPWTKQTLVVSSGASWSCTWCLEASELEKQPG